MRSPHHCPEHEHHVHGPPWARRRLWGHRLRLYYGAHLHRHLFLWFGAAIFITALAVGAAVHMTGGRAVGRPWGGLVFFGVPALILWIASGKLARRVARPLYELVRVSEQIGRGNLSARARLACAGSDEIAILAHAINDMAARIERQLADQRELLAGVSHELRTPLARLRILVELARERGVGEGTWDDIERELVEVDALVAELLASARLDFHALVPRPLDAAEVARRALERAGLPGARLVVDAADTTFQGDPTLIARALANLIDNAQRHGRGLEHLRVATRPGFVVFDVEDRGPGLGPGEETRIFSSFYQGEAGDREPARGGGSLGLGLALVARIARAHGGTVAAANRDGGGARLTLALAVQPPSGTPRQDA